MKALITFYATLNLCAGIAQFALTNLEPAKGLGFVQAGLSVFALLFIANYS